MTYMLAGKVSLVHNLDAMKTHHIFNVQLKSEIYNKHLQNFI